MMGRAHLEGTVRLGGEVANGDGRHDGVSDQAIAMLSIYRACYHRARCCDYLAASVAQPRSEEHTSELQSLMRISYAVFCLKKKKNTARNNNIANPNPRLFMGVILTNAKASVHAFDHITYAHTQQSGTH